MGHIGLTPQSATKLGGFRAQGRTAEAALKLYDDALALQDAGCFAVVLEAVPAPVAARITRGARDPDDRDRRRRRLRRPGARLARPARDVRRAGAAVRQALRELADEIGDRARAPTSRDVRSGAFPEEQHTYSIPDDELEPLRGRARASARRASTSTSAAATRDRRRRRAAAARAHVQPCTARDADQSSTTDQTSERRAASTANTLPPRARVGAAAWKSVARRERELQRPERRARARPAPRRTRARAGCAGTSPASRAATTAPCSTPPKNQ